MDSEVVAEDVRRGRAQREEYVEWFKGMFGSELGLVTLTFRDIKGQVPTLTRGRRCAKLFAEGMQSSGFAGVIVEERGSLNERLHYHAATRIGAEGDNLKGLAFSVILGEWEVRNGFVSVRRGSGGAIEYVCKYLAKGDLAWWEVFGVV